MTLGEFKTVLRQILNTETVIGMMSKIILLILLAELSILIFAFDIDFFYNFWWVLELAVVIISLGLEFFGPTILSSSSGWLSDTEGGMSVIVLSFLCWRVIRVVHSLSDMIEKCYTRSAETSELSSLVRHEALHTFRNRALVNAIETTSQRLRLGLHLGRAQKSKNLLQIDVRSINVRALEKENRVFQAIIALQVLRKDETTGEFRPHGKTRYTSYPVASSNSEGQLEQEAGVTSKEKVHEHEHEHEHEHASSVAMDGALDAHPAVLAVNTPMYSTVPTGHIDHHTAYLIQQSFLLGAEDGNNDGINDEETLYFDQEKGDVIEIRVYDATQLFKPYAVEDYLSVKPLVRDRGDGRASIYSMGNAGVMSEASKPIIKVPTRDVYTQYQQEFFRECSAEHRITVETDHGGIVFKDHREVRSEWVPFGVTDWEQVRSLSLLSLAPLSLSLSLSHPLSLPPTPLCAIRTASFLDASLHIYAHFKQTFPSLLSRSFPHTPLLEYDVWLERQIWSPFVASNWNDCAENPRLFGVQ